MPMPTTISEEDEFDSIFDDQPLDAELEESLALVEASFTASQAPPQSTISTRPPSRFVPQSSAANRSWGSSSGNRKGTFVPPLKKQRLENGHASSRSHLRHEAVIPGDAHLWPRHKPLSIVSRGVAVRSTSREPAADEIIIRNLKDDEFGDGDDDWWAGNEGLVQAEEEAIRMSQQTLSQQQLSVPARTFTRQVSAASSTAASAPDDNLADVDQLRSEVEELRRRANEQEELVRKLREQTRAKEGEVKVVRSNLNKLNQENAALRETSVRKEQEHKRQLEKLNTDNQRQMEMLETATAFRRVEQDTSRHAWPSSVRRLPPAGMRERQDTQAAAGLTTPTKRSRYDRGSTTPNSKSTPRSLGRTSVGVDRPEPASPSCGKERMQAGKTLGKGKAKAPAFPGFQNSFGAFELPKKQRQGGGKSTSPEIIRRPAPRLQRESHHDDFEQQDTIDITMDEVEEVPRPAAVPSGSAPTTPPKDGATSKEGEVEVYRRKQRYLWAVGELIRKRAELVGQVLCHTCQPPSAPFKPPRTKYNPNRAADSDSYASVIDHESTLHRLINIRFPDGIPVVLSVRYARTIQYLLSVLAQGSVSDGEERFSFLLNHDEGWEEGLEDGMQDLYDGLAAALQTLMGVFVRLCMTDCLRDALKLASSLCIAYPRLTEKILTPQDAVWCYKAYEQEDGNDLDTPRSVTLILIETVRKCNHAKISATSPASVLTTAPEEDAGPSSQAQTQSRLVPRATNKGRGKEAAAVEEERAWYMGDEARVEVVQAVLDMLEVLCWTFKGPHPLEQAVRFIGESEGFLHTLLDSKRKSPGLVRTVRLMAYMSWNPSLVHACLAARPDASLGHAAAGSSRSAGKFPILEVLSKHLVDRRHDLPEPLWHSLHRTILILLTQAAIKSSDTLTILAESAPLLAALIKCLSLDTDLFWNIRPVGLEDRGIEHLVERLTVDTRLLGILYRYQYPLRIQLAAKLEHQEANNMLNGIRQSFIVAMNRLAFAPEPEWLEEQKMLMPASAELYESVSTQLEAIADLAGDLVDLVLSPDETDAIYELLADEEEEQEEVVPSSQGFEDEDEAAVAAEAHPVESGSETEEEPEREVIELLDSE